MNNLFAELLKEATRVHALETEVKRTKEDLTNQICLAREEKLAEIVSFLDEMNSIFTNTCPGEYMVIFTSGKYTSGNHQWSNSVRFGGKRVWLGIYLTGSKMFEEKACVGNRMIIDHPERTCFHNMVMSFIDEWSNETKQFTEKSVADAIRKVLEKRIEKATADLKVVNDKHEEYFGKEM